MNNNIINEVEYTNSCRFNSGVSCGEYKCNNCGWNPEVNARRVEEIKARRRAEANTNE